MNLPLLSSTLPRKTTYSKGRSLRLRGVSGALHLTAGLMLLASTAFAQTPSRAVINIDVTGSTDIAIYVNGVQIPAMTPILTPLPAPVPTPTPTPPPQARAILVASNPIITLGQVVTLTLTLPTADFHNIFINGMRPTSCIPGSCTLLVAPTITTLYQATATNSIGTPYLIAPVTVVVGPAG